MMNNNYWQEKYREEKIKSEKLVTVNRESTLLNQQLAKALIDAIAYINVELEGDETMMDKYVPLLDKAKRRGAFLINPNDIKEVDLKSPYDNVKIHEILSMDEEKAKGIE